MSAVPRSLAVLVAALGCASFDPQPLDTLSFRDHAQTETRLGVTVSVAVMSEEETRRAFDVKLQATKIQPVWVRIENDLDEELVFLSVSLDPEYFSPHETSWKNHFFLSGEANRAMDDYVHANQLDLVIAPHSTAEGFVYTNLSRGVKLVSVNLVGDSQLLEFNFLFEIPGFRADYLEVDFDELYAEEEIRDVDLAGLRDAIRALPCCVLGGDQKTDGDPLNLVVVGDGRLILATFIQRDWHLTERLHAGSLWGTVKSSLFASEYKNSPISPLYLFGRPQDVGLQKARGSVDERNHLRLWLAPFRYRGEDVWVGQISRDIGVRLSRKTFVTHEIDPEVDEARDYAAQDLMLSQGVHALAFASGVGAAPQDQPRHNYTLSPYFTDGLRAVIFLSEENVALDEVDFVDWALPPQISSEVSAAPER